MLIFGLNIPFLICENDENSSSPAKVRSGLESNDVVDARRSFSFRISSQQCRKSASYSANRSRLSPFGRDGGSAIGHMFV